MSRNYLFVIIKKKKLSSKMRDDRGSPLVNFVCRTFYSPWKKVKIVLSNWLLKEWNSSFSFFFLFRVVLLKCKVQIHSCIHLFHYINMDCNIQGVYLLNRRNKPQMLVNILMFGLCESFFFFFFFLKKNPLYFSPVLSKCVVYDTQTYVMNANPACNLYPCRNNIHLLSLDNSNTQTIKRKLHAL